MKVDWKVEYWRRYDYCPHSLRPVEVTFITLHKYNFSKLRFSHLQVTIFKITFFTLTNYDFQNYVSSEHT